MNTQTNENVIITCAVTGSALTHKKNPAVPVSPAEIAQSALDAAAAGASIVHIHVRDIETGHPSGDLALYREVMQRIEDSGSDVIINISTGYGGFFIPGEGENVQTGAPGSNLQDADSRIRHIVDLQPEICSLDVGTANFGDRVFMNTPPHLREMSTQLTAAGSKPEIEVFEAGHVEFAKHLLNEGYLKAPGHFQLCMGIPWCMPATPEAVAFMRSLLPDDATWSAFAISRAQFDMVDMALDQGGHIRVGLEDNIWIEKGVLAPSNAALVEKAAGIIAQKGKNIATAAQAREILGLGSEVS